MLSAAPEYKLQYSETPLEDLLNEMGTDREDFQTPEVKTDIINSAESNPEHPEAKPPVPPAGGDAAPVESAAEKAERRGKQQNTAKWLGKNTDRAMAFVCSLIADSDDIEEWKAQPDDLKDIIDCYFDMCEGYGWTGLPPWLNLVMCIGFTYGPEMREAYKIRGVNKEMAAKAARAEAEKHIAEAELRRIKLEQEKAKLKDIQDKQEAKEKKETNDSKKTDGPAGTEKA